MSDRQLDYERMIAPIADRMMRVVWRISREPAEAEDVFQEALLTIWKRWDRIRAHPNPHALILQICVNAALDGLRRRARQKKRFEDNVPEDVPDASRSTVHGILAAEQDRQVLQAIALLPKNQARAMLMYAVEEMEYRDIAAAMSCQEVTVRKHVSRARAKLRILLSHLIPAFHTEKHSHV